MKTVMIVLSLMALMAACNDKTKEPVDQTRTTSAIIVQPTLHDGHAAEPAAPASEEEEMEMMDVDEIDMSGTSRDGG